MEKILKLGGGRKILVTRIFNLDRRLSSLSSVSLNAV